MAEPIRRVRDTPPIDLLPLLHSGSEDEPSCLARAEVAWELGLGDRAREEEDRARKSLMRKGDRAVLAAAYLWLARIEVGFGDPWSASISLDKAQGILSSGVRLAEPVLHAAVRAEWAWATGRDDLATWIDRLGAEARDARDPWWEAWALHLQALAALNPFRPDQVISSVEAAQALPEAVRRSPNLAWRTEALLSVGAGGDRHRQRANTLLHRQLDGLPSEVREAYLRRRDRAALHQLLVAGLPVPSDRAGSDLRRISRVVRSMITESDVPTLLRLIVDSLVESTRADTGLLVLTDGDPLDVTIRRGAKGRDLAIDEAPLSLRIAREVASRGKVLCISNASEDPQWKDAESVAEWKLVSVLCVPLRFRERTMGSVFLETRRESAAFGPQDRELAETLADQAAVVLENALLAEKAQMDPLTGLANHPVVERRLAEEVARCQRAKRSCAFLLLDVDHFKQVNDTCGHDAGNQVLRDFALTLQRCLRFSDVAGRPGDGLALLGRFGGDEFEILLCDTGADGLARAAERVLHTMAESPFTVNGTRVRLSVSIGGASYPRDARSAQELFLRADEALYEAKRVGRNRFVLYSPAPVREPSGREMDELLLSRYGREVVELLTRVMEHGDDLKEVANQALQAIVRATSADRGFVLLFGEKDQVQIRSAFNLRDEEMRPERFRLSFGVVMKLVQQGRPVRAESVAGDPTLREMASISELGLTSLVAVPIPGAVGPAGVIYLDSTSPEKNFTAEDELLLTRFATLLGRTLGQAALWQERSFQLARLQEVVSAGLKDLQAQYRFDALIGESPQIRQIRVSLDHIVRFPYPVLVMGETGTGKEVVAKAIHANSPRKDHPLVAVNCAALPKELLESELFGHTRGAFTGADKEHLGLFRSAHLGTLFLDEIGETPVELQKKLLRVLQEGEFVPVGGSAPIRCDVRIIAATNSDLEQGVREGRFRDDLYYRLKVFRVVLPPLRDRPEDIPLLARLFLDRAIRESGGAPKELPQDTLKVLARHRWPGNVRELENAMRYAVAYSKDVVRPEHLPADILEPPRPREADPGEGGVPWSDRGLKPAEELWAALIKKTLEEVDWNQSAAAKQLGISRSTLHYKMRAFGLRPRP